MIEIGDYSKAYKCPVCNTEMMLIKKDGDYQWIYQCDGYDHNSGVGVNVKQAEMDEREG